MRICVVNEHCGKCNDYKWKEKRQAGLCCFGMEEIMLLGIDHGNYAVKTTGFDFVSGLAEHTVRPPMTEEILEYQGKYWTLSGKRLS